MGLKMIWLTTRVDGVCEEEGCLLVWAKGHTGRTDSTAPCIENKPLNSAKL